MEAEAAVVVLQSVDAAVLRRGRQRHTRVRRVRLHLRACPTQKRQLELDLLIVNDMRQTISMTKFVKAAKPSIALSCSTGPRPPVAVLDSPYLLPFPIAAYTL